MPESAATTSRLSTREREIAELVATGKSNRAVGESLHLSERTVERHVSAIFNKLEVHSRAELISAVFAGALHSGAPWVPDAAQLEAAAQSSAAQTNLPSPRTNLVGRTAEVADILSILRGNRLVTVTGAGAFGKSRTALAVGGALVSDSESGVWLVELAPVAQGSFVAATVARALSVQESPTSPLLETLLAYLKAKALVVILDNCEHVIAEVAALANALLRNCPISCLRREPVSFVPICLGTAVLCRTLFNWQSELNARRRPLKIQHLTGAPMAPLARAVR
jgi:DNA-binding CsgD family transcriptional regulator